MIPTEINDLMAEHRSNEKRVCYAPTLEPITAVHQFGGRTEAKILRCTRPLGHTDVRRDATQAQHVDGACCYSPHRFDPDMAGPPDPTHYSWERCVKCGQDWPCDVSIIATALREVES